MSILRASYQLILVAMCAGAGSLTAQGPNVPLRFKPWEAQTDEVGFLTPPPSRESGRPTVRIAAAHSRGMIFGGIAGGVVGAVAGWRICKVYSATPGDGCTRGGVLGAAAGGLLGAFVGYMLTR